MKRNETSFAALVSIFVVALVTSNVLASKVLQLGPFEVPAAILAYPFTFLITDVVGELWDRSHAHTVVRIGIVCQIISLIMIYCAICLPSASYQTEFSHEFSDVLGGTFRVVAASLIGFICSQTCDVFIFHTLKEKKEKQKWLRNNVSTVFSQVIDSTVFITIAFSGQGYDLLLMIGSQILIKWLIALADTPLFYYLTKGSTKVE